MIGRRKEKPTESGDSRTHTYMGVIGPCRVQGHFGVILHSLHLSQNGPELEKGWL